MFERLDAIKVKYEELTEKLSSPEVLGDYNQLKKLSKEQKDLEPSYMKYNEYKKTEEFKNSPANRLMELMKQVCATNGYYEKFIPAMRKLSPLYNEYYEEMLKANEQFIKNYPEYTE